MCRRSGPRSRTDMPVQIRTHGTGRRFRPMPPPCLGVSCARCADGIRPVSDFCSRLDAPLYGEPGPVHFNSHTAVVPHATGLFATRMAPSAAPPNRSRRLLKASSPRLQCRRRSSTTVPGAKRIRSPPSHSLLTKKRKKTSERASLLAAHLWWGLLRAFSTGGRRLRMAGPKCRSDSLIGPHSVAMPPAMKHRESPKPGTQPTGSQKIGFRACAAEMGQK